MTEAEWFAQTDPGALLSYLSGRISDRQLRLLAIACYGKVWEPKDEDFRRSVNVMEKFADGEIDSEQMLATLASPPGWPLRWSPAPWIGRCLAGTNNASLEGVFHVIHWMCQQVGAAEETRAEQRQSLNPAGVLAATYDAAQAIQAELLREITGNPFRTAALNSGLLLWNDGIIPDIARTIYRKRRFELLPILADALVDAGCDHYDLIAHCRKTDGHVRGCWAVDWVLDKK